MTIDPADLDYREPEWVAQKLGLDKNTIYKFLQDGTIPAVQLGRKWLISEARLAQWLRDEAESQTRARREAVQSTDRTLKRMDTLTAGARLAVKHAHSEARRYGHDHLDQHHLLLGLATDPRSVSSQALGELAIQPGDIRRDIESHSPASGGTVARRLGRSSEAKRAMRLAARIATRQADSTHETLVGTDHLLLGVLLARRGRGYEFLKHQGVTRQRLRDALEQVKARHPHDEGATHESGKR